MTVDVVEILQTQIKTLRDVDRLTEAEVANYINALDTILDYVDNIDTANGKILKQYLSSNVLTNQKQFLRSHFANKIWLFL